MLDILIITTGGTIGSAQNNGAVNVIDGGDVNPPVVEMYRAEHPHVRFDVMPVMNILSENLCAGDLNTLAKALLTADLEKYHGVIVLCGSDNLAYLASFIGLLTYRRKPVMTVASDKVLTDPAGNGYENFCTAVGLISDSFCGPCVPYRNTGGMLIHSAFDIRQADLSSDFYSFSGRYTDTKNLHGGSAVSDAYIRQTIPDVFDAAHLPVIREDVLLIHPYPMLDYDALDITGKRAVIHTLYHSSTLNSDGAIRLLRRLGDVPMYLASFRGGKPRYQTAIDVIGAGAIPLTDISPECAYMKLVLACAQDRMSVREFMEG